MNYERLNTTTNSTASTIVVVVEARRFFNEPATTRKQQMLNGIHLRKWSDVYSSNGCVAGAVLQGYGFRNSNVPNSSVNLRLCKRYVLIPTRVSLQPVRMIIKDVIMSLAYVGSLLVLLELFGIGKEMDWLLRF